MGYPMSYSRVLERNQLRGNYTSTHYEGVSDAYRTLIDSSDVGRIRRMIAGDLRRLEKDVVDGGPECERIAFEAGVTFEVAKRVLSAFFTGAPSNREPHDAS